MQADFKRTGSSNDSLLATAVDTAATAAALAHPTISTMQQRQGSKNLVGRAPVDGLMLLWAAAQCRGGAGVQGGQGGGAKLSRKRSAEASGVQPAGKRWRVEAIPSTVAGSLGQHDSMWEAANAAGNGGGSCSSDAGQGSAEGAVASCSIRANAAMLNVEGCAHV